MVNFVGAGCGALDLITVRGMKFLQHADVIIYTGSLINPQLLKYANPNCEVYNSAYMSLEEVIGVILNAENNNKTTVRLHCGDPCIYGAIREQFDILNKNNIKYEVCPGVSSFCGAAAALKAEYTLPDISQTVILTRIEGRTTVPKKEKISLLAQHNATMIIFLSTGLLFELSVELQNGGYPPNTPAAIVYNASWSNEKVCRCTIDTLVKVAETNHIKKNALICVGNFLGKDYSLSRLYDRNFETEFRKVQK